MMTRCKHWALLILFAGMLLGTAGCSNSRYLTNRYYDFRDMGAVAVGVSSQNSCTGLFPPALGAYVEVTDFLHLGAITHSGYVAELDMRGSGVYYEERTRLGLLFWQAIHDDQDYTNARYRNYFKTPGNMWERWMRGCVMSWGDSPAKDLTYDHWMEDMQYGFFLRHRGWQYWEYIGGEFAICEPFLTHLGVTLRLGFDPSEISDFVLGWFGVDFNHDDLDCEMFNDMRQKRVLGIAESAKPAPVPAPDAAEMARLRAENDRLAKALADCQGQLKEASGGVEIVLPEHILFDTGRAVLKDSGKRLLDQIAMKIRNEYLNDDITVEGHTDSRPVVHTKGLWKSNWELGAARSLAVVHYLIDQAGLPKTNFTAATPADNKPVASNETKEGRQQNRRAVIVLKAKKRATEPVPAVSISQ